jgi:APA family basic amino acid/polyamine antiporter
VTSDAQDLEEVAGEPQLRRSIGTTQLALYALGSMVGSGVYGLIGKAAGQAGSAVWLSFIVALFAALLTSLSYASLGSRYPRAGGAAYVTDRAFGIPILSFTIGLALVASGLTSVATQSKIFAAILADVTGLDALPPTAIAAGFLLILGGIVFRGIRESMWINVLCTLLEVSGSYSSSSQVFHTGAPSITLRRLRIAPTPPSR